MPDALLTPSRRRRWAARGATLALVLLVAFVVVVALAAIRIYAAGVLLYGQRPGIRAFISAARRAAS